MERVINSEGTTVTRFTENEDRPLFTAQRKIDTEDKNSAALAKIAQLIFELYSEYGYSEPENADVQAEQQNNSHKNGGEVNCDNNSGTVGIKQQIKCILNKYGISRKYCGYVYLALAVEEVVSAHYNGGTAPQGLYARVSSKLNVTSSAVEMGIHNALINSPVVKDENVRKELLGPYSTKKAPTNREIIFAIADKVIYGND